MTRVRSGVIRIGAGAAVGQAVALAVSPWLARQYDPVDFAVLGIVTALASILSAVVTLRLDLAAMVPDSESEAWIVRDAAVLSSVSIGMVAVLPLALVATPLAAALGVPQAAGLLWTVGPIAAVIGWFQADNVILARRSDHNRLAVRQALQSVLQVGIQLLTSAWGAAGLVLGFGSGRALSLSLWPRKPTAGRTSVKQVAAAVRRYRRFPLISTWSGLLNATGQMAMLLVIGAAFGSQVSGQFAFTFRIVTAPVALITLAFSQVFIGEVKARPGGARDVARETSRRLLLVGTAPVLLVCAVAPFAFPLIFGSTWTQAGWMALAMAPMLAAQVVVSPVSQALNIEERQKEMLAWDVLRVVLVTAAPLLLAAAGVAPVPTIALTSVAIAIAYLGLYLIIVRRPGEVVV